jgi:hypothetical protein
MINWGYVAGFFDGEGNLHRDRLPQFNSASTILVKRQYERYRNLSSMGESLTEEERNHIIRTGSA